MQEIKFRAWHPKLGMSKVIRIDFAHGLNVAPIDICCDRNDLSDNEWVIMLYTGLKDKNGQNIYDSDIVNVTNKAGNNGNKFIVYDKVLLSFVAVWANRFNKWTDSNCGTTYLKVSSGLKCEVIGNIYDNPELLK